MSRFTKRKKSLALLGVPVFFGAQAAWGAVDTWTGTTSNDWTVSTNWSGTAPPPTSVDTASFTGSSSNNSITLDGATQNLSVLLINPGAVAYDIGITPGDTLNFSSGGAIGATATVSQTIAANVSLPTGAFTITNQLNSAGATSAVLLDFSGVISGNTTVTLSGVSGTGKGRFEFDGANTYSGGLVLTNGDIFDIGSSSVGSSPSITSGPLGTGTVAANNNIVLEAVKANQTIANPIIVGSGDSINFGFSNVAGVPQLTLSGPLTFSGASHTLNDEVIGSNPLVLGASTSSASTITLNGTGTAGNLAFAVSPGGTILLNDVIQDSSITGNVVSYNTDNGGFGKVLISGANTYAGATSLNGAGAVLEIGVNSVGNPGSLTSGPFGTGQLLPNNSTTPPILEPDGANRVVGNAISLAGSGFIVANDASGNYNLTLSGPISLTVNRVINNNMSSGAALILGLAGSPSTITLGTTSAEQLQIQTNGGSSAPTVINDVIQNATGGGAGNLVFLSGGPVYLNASNTYTGFTKVFGAGSTSSAVGTGGTLAGTGWAGTAGGTVYISTNTAGNYGGMIAPGTATATAGTINVPSMQFNPYGRYIFEHQGLVSTAGSGVNDLISGSGNLDLTNLSLSTPFDLNLVPLTSGDGVTSESYTIAAFGNGITSGGNTLTAGTFVTSDFSFSGETTGSAPTVEVVNDTTGLSGSDPEDLLLTFIPAQTPEPSSIAFIAAAAGGLLGRRRRRHRHG